MVPIDEMSDQFLFSQALRRGILASAATLSIAEPA
jgi:hypothetical protein